MPFWSLSLAGALAVGIVSGGAGAAGPVAVKPPGSSAVIQVAAGLETLPPQMRLAYARGIQKELLAHGYAAGVVDGVIGSRTRAAIRDYQRDAGLAVDGAASKELLDHLKFASPKVNAFGEPVQGVVLDVQRELADRGYYLGPHDGIAGPATWHAVRWFRSDARLAAGGEIDSYFLQQIRDAPAEVSVEP
jgi:peptidoglycan hydrolase-like protein with peptidoglycan-binding domain